MMFHLGCFRLWSPQYCDFSQGGNVNIFSNELTLLSVIYCRCFQWLVGKYLPFRNGCKPFVEVYVGEERVLTTTQEYEQMRSEWNYCCHFDVWQAWWTWCWNCSSSFIFLDFWSSCITVKARSEDTQWIWSVSIYGTNRNFFVGGSEIYLFDEMWVQRLHNWRRTGYAVTQHVRIWWCDNYCISCSVYVRWQSSRKGSFRTSVNGSSYELLISDAFYISVMTLLHCKFINNQESTICWLPMRIRCVALASVRVTRRNYSQVKLNNMAMSCMTLAC